MLLTLSIQNLAVVKSLELNLAKGMSVLTGETGAGKSILLTALGLALGERASSDYIRPNCQRAEVSLAFDISPLSSVLDWLKENQLDDDDQCLIRRTVTEDGRSKAYVNDCAVSLQTLQKLTRQLVEIHGQHAYLTLLDSDEQRRLLDNYGQYSPLIASVEACYVDWRNAYQEWSALQQKRSECEQRHVLLRYQLDELQLLNLAQFDFTSLSERHQKLANVEQILQVGQRQVETLYENDQSLYRHLTQSIKALSNIQQFAPEIQSIINLMTDAQIQIEEGVNELRRFLDNQEVDPTQLQEIEQQIGLLQTLSRKHQVKPDALYTLQLQLEQEFEAIGQNDERMEALEQLVQHYQQAYQPLAEALSRQRQQNAQKLQQHISAMMKELGMPNGEFLIEINTQQSDVPQLNGNETVSFLISTNVGLPPKPLSKVASGGELSRISLAIQVATATDKSTPMMIFDEVDSGIGGGIAEIVGQKLRQLSENRQILCVTHLPQVAAQAHQHLYVSKQNVDDMTASQVTLLSEDARVYEIARMLGGVEITENTLAHAREMLLVKKA
jgi:DNA repair protein RecN (Recombination protein N)